MFCMITRLLHTRYRVNDLEKTATFYKDVLGLKEVSRHSSPPRAQVEHAARRRARDES